jgi:hypothetical protein
MGLLTKRQREILTQMAAHPHDDLGELVYERGAGYLGNDRVAPKTVFALLWLCVLHLDSGEPGCVERYTINETGVKLLAGDVTDLALLAAARARGISAVASGSRRGAADR